MVTRRTRIWRALGQRESGEQGDETANPQVHDSPVQLRATPSAIKEETYLNVQLNAAQSSHSE